MVFLRWVETGKFFPMTEPIAYDIPVSFAAVFRDVTQCSPRKSNGIRILIRDKLDCYFYNLLLILKPFYAELNEHKMLNSFGLPLN